jgi:pimeloyl-ACP methyl ester carboxylesterase
VAAVLAAQAGHAGRPWYELATRWFDQPASLAYLARLLDFEPAEVLPRVGCPVLALFGAADSLVPVPASVAAYAAGLPRTEQLAPGFLPMLGGFLASVGGRGPAD